MRKAISLKHKLAAALRELFKIPHDHAKEMTADQMLSLVQWHHNEYHAHDGSDEHWNIEPMLIKAHRERTAKIDAPQIAKTRRISQAHEEFRARLLQPKDHKPERRSKWPKRKLPKKRQSRTRGKCVSS